MARVLSGKTVLDRCVVCDVTWLESETFEAIAGGKSATLLELDRVARCHVCSRELWPAELSGLRLLVCIGCGGVLLSDLKLDRVLGPAARLSFLCDGCGDRYALATAVHFDHQLLCVHCAPFKRSKA